MKHQPTVYLSGPISGCDFEAATRWRKHVSAMLWPDIVTLDPLRGMHDEFKTSMSIPVHLRKTGAVTDRSIMKRDHFDTLRADLVFCNLLGAARSSLGTVMELAWAYDHHIPVALVMEDSGNLHDHPMVRESAAWRYPGVDEAIAEVRHALVASRKTW